VGLAHTRIICFSQPQTYLAIVQKTEWKFEPFKCEIEVVCDAGLNTGLIMNKGRNEIQMETGKKSDRGKTTCQATEQTILKKRPKLFPPL